MEEVSRNFKDLGELNEFIQEKKAGSILIGYQNMPEYAGMVLGIGIIFDIDKLKYELDLEWISFGLDLFGENLLENHLYEFNGLEELLSYLASHYHILLTDIPVNYRIDQSRFPNPIKDSDQKEVFESAWQKFQDDFKKGVFLDDSLKLVFSSSSIS